MKRTLLTIEFVILLVALGYCLWRWAHPYPGAVKFEEFSINTNGQCNNPDCFCRKGTSETIHIPAKVDATAISLDPNAGQVFTTMPPDANDRQVDSIELSSICPPIPISLGGVTGVTIHQNRMTAWVDVNDPNCLTDASICLLATSGRLCRVLGHQWEDGKPGQDYLARFQEERMTGNKHRFCSLCTAVESRQLMEWAAPGQEGRK